MLMGIPFPFLFIPPTLNWVKDQDLKKKYNVSSNNCNVPRFSKSFSWLQMAFHEIVQPDAISARGPCSFIHSCTLHSFIHSFKYCIDSNFYLKKTPNYIISTRFWWWKFCTWICQCLQGLCFHISSMHKRQRRENHSKKSLTVQSIYHLTLRF